MLQERKVSRRVVLKGALGTSVGLVVGSAGYGYSYERHRVQITRATLPVSGLPDALNGLRVALVTDTHFSGWVPAEDIEAAVRLTLQERPDLIILGGDYVTWGGDVETKGDRGYVGGAAELLAPLTAPHGVFAILGNHDDDRHMPEALAARGFTVLRDARTRVTIRGEPLEIAGIRYWTRRIEHIARVLRGATATTILLAHDPRRLIEAASLNVGAVFSGHTHGGQIVVPGIGPIAARRFPVVAGAGSQDNTSIFVSRGVGTVYLPVRLNCPPEVAIIELAARSIEGI
jgi:predicted MPP superfamily phosphohydrolase